MTEGWEESASAWIASLGEHGDYSREWVLDRPMLERVERRAPATVLDVGCGEGRFCRMLRAKGIHATGIDPIEPLLARARSLDPQGDYRLGRAEALDFPDACFDLVVSYLTLVDIPDMDRAIAEMARVLRPGGALLIANVTSFATASSDGWTRDAGGALIRPIDNYLEEHAPWVEWKGIRIRNHHRPLSRYMTALLNQGLILRYFDEPKPHGGNAETTARYIRVPWHLMMEWEKPRDAG